MGSEHLSATFEVIALAFMVAIIIFDLLIVVKRPHVPSFKECGIWVAVYVSLALLFGLILMAVGNAQIATEFYAGWLTEYSLSIDNLFIFVIILAKFKVPPRNQQEALMVGIIIALMLRAIMIVLGAALIERYSWVFYIFGAYLLYTAWGLVKGEGDDDEEFKESRFVAWVRKRAHVADNFDGGKFRTVIDGKRMWTPMLLVAISLGATDLVFALDSIPAIFGLTKDPFIVFSTNLFALMGLRQLYFMLGGLLDRLVYLPKGLAFILFFIGVKLVLEAMHTNSLSFINGGEPLHVPEVPIWLSLTVIAGTLILSTVLSLTIGVKRHPLEEAHSPEVPHVDGASLGTGPESRS